MTVAVLTALGSFFAGFGAASSAAGVVDGGVAAAGPGVLARLGAVLTVKSFPCVSKMAAGNLANTSSRILGKFALAISNSLLISGVGAVERDQKN